MQESVIESGPPPADTKKLSICILSLDLGLELDYRFASKLRGYIGNTFREYPILHHHIDDLGYLYTYPRVQYKVIMGQPLIVGIDEGARAVEEIAPKLERIEMDRSYEIVARRVMHMTEMLGPSEESQAYEFLTPWLALNEENLKLYDTASLKNRQALLRKVLIGNILSMCKGLNQVVKRRLRAAVFLKPTKATYKNIEFLAFKGTFLVNYQIPCMAGIGKGSSHGFGTVKKLEL